MPRCILPLCAALLAAALGAAVRADEPSKQDKLEATLRQLEKDIAAVRGLAFKSPVKGKVISRPKDADRSVQGYYDLKEKALFVYDDVAGNYERGVLIHEMVHALQDQHFNLSKLHQATFEDDAELGRAALVEGDATFTMIELLKKEQPPVLKMLDAPLVKARNLQKAFLYSQGARYVKALKERGGWPAVNAAYRFPPGSTAEVLHPEGVATIDLGPGKTRGELMLLRLLAGGGKTAAGAEEAAAGWRGDRYREADGGGLWLIACASDAAARRCRDALAELTGEQKKDYTPDRPDAEGRVWKGPQGERLGVLASGPRVAVIEAPSETAYRALRERAFGPPALSVWSRKDKKEISFGEFTERMLDADLICVGEKHDSELNHQIQLQIIKALFARDERLGVGLEMFQRPFQAALDRYGRGELVEEEFLALTEYRTRWGFNWALYRPIADFCKHNGVPLAALNAPRELTRRVSQVGHAALTDDEKKQLGPIDFQVKEHRAYWYERLAAMHGEKDVPEEKKERSYQVMTVWDEYMADSAASFQKERKVRRLVVLAGSGHIERGFGIPDRAVKRTGGKAVTVGVETEKDLDKVREEAATDYVVVVR
jgi:uncharacterized iron-regulated protein